MQCTCAFAKALKCKRSARHSQSHLAGSWTSSKSGCASHVVKIICELPRHFDVWGHAKSESWCGAVSQALVPSLERVYLFLSRAQACVVTTDRDLTADTAFLCTGSLHVMKHGPAPCVSASFCPAAGVKQATDVCRDLDKQEAEIREKLKQERKREDRKNREAFSDLLREDMDDGFIKPKMRWRVRLPTHACLLIEATERKAGADCSPCMHHHCVCLNACLHAMHNVASRTLCFCRSYTQWLSWCTARLHAYTAFAGSFVCCILTGDSICITSLSMCRPRMLLSIIISSAYSG